MHLGRTWQRVWSDSPNEQECCSTIAGTAAATEQSRTLAPCDLQGGDFIVRTKQLTGAKVGVDKPVGGFDERLVHVEGFDE